MNPIQLGERLRIEVPNVKDPSGDKHSTMAWAAKKDKHSGKAFNVLNIGTKHMHFAQLEANTTSSLTSLVSFKSAEGYNTLLHDTSSTSNDDVVRYGVAYSLRCLTKSKAGGRYLSPNNDLLAWDRHADALRTDHATSKAKADADDDFKDPEHHAEMFRVIHLVATNMRRDWQEDIQAAGNPLVPTSRFGLVHEQRLEAGKPAFVAASANGTQLHFVPDLGPLCVFVVKRTSLDQILKADGLLATRPKTLPGSKGRSNTEDGEDVFVPGESFVGEMKQERASVSTTQKLLDNFPNDFIECQTYSYGQWIARKGEYHFCTTDNKPLKAATNLVPWWTADGLSHWRVSLDADDNDGDGEISTDNEGWMYGKNWNKMFKNENPQVSNESKGCKHRIRKYETFGTTKLMEWDERCGTCAGELSVPKWRLAVADSDGKTVSQDGGAGANGGTTTNNGGTTNEDDDDEGGFQHAELPSTTTTGGSGGKLRTQSQIEHDEALELAYHSLTQGEESLKKHHVEGVEGFEKNEFDTLDANGDGTVTLEEFKNHARKSKTVKKGAKKGAAVDVSAIWAGQALLPQQTQWKGRVMITNKWKDSGTNVQDYAVLAEMLAAYVEVDGNSSTGGDTKNTDEEQKEEATKKNSDGKEKKKSKRKKDKKKSKKDQEGDKEKNENLISNGRPYLFGELSIDIATSVLRIAVTTNTKEGAGTEKVIEINLKERGRSIASIPEQTVAHNSLEESIRNQAQQEFDTSCQSIADLQERRKNLPPNNKR